MRNNNQRTKLKIFMQ